jgi:protein-disulfide isomerase
MPRLATALAAIAAVLASALVALPAAAAPAPAAPAAVPGDMSLGSPGAKVTVVEYASVTCPHCARFNNEVFPAFKAKYIDTGKVRYVFREFPTSPVEVAAAGFLVARCSPADKYFAVIDALFKAQEALYASRDGKPYLLAGGKAGGLSEAQVQTCLEDKAQLDAFNDRVKLAFETGGVKATPTFVIGSTTLEGEQTLAQLDAVLAPLLAR